MKFCKFASLLLVVLMCTAAFGCSGTGTKKDAAPTPLEPYSKTNVEYIAPYITAVINAMLSNGSEYDGTPEFRWDVICETASGDTSSSVAVPAAGQAKTIDDERVSNICATCFAGDSLVPELSENYANAKKTDGGYEITKASTGNYIKIGECAVKGDAYVANVKIFDAYNNELGEYDVQLALNSYDTSKNVLMILGVALAK